MDARSDSDLESVVNPVCGCGERSPRPRHVVLATCNPPSTLPSPHQNQSCRPVSSVLETRSWVSLSCSAATRRAYPLALDMQVTGGEALLAKYNLKANDAVLAEGNQSEM